MSVPITVVVLTKNEADNIRRCLKSLLWCKEIILLDDSQDQTVALAAPVLPKTKLRIIKANATGDFAVLRNNALTKVRYEWVLFIDADETVTPELAREITQAIGSKRKNGYLIRRQDNFLGKWLKYGETGDIKLLKLGRKYAGKWRRRVHEAWEIKGEIGELKSPLLHHPHPTISEFIERINRWTTLDAEEFYNAGVRSSWGKVIAYPSGKFIRNYIFKLGFLDGTPGLLFAILMSMHSFLTRGKLFLLNQNKNHTF